MVSGDAEGMDSGQVQRDFLKQIKEFELKPEGIGKASKKFKQATVTIIISLYIITLASVCSKG